MIGHHPWSWEAGHSQYKSQAQAWVRRVNRIKGIDLGVPDQDEDVLLGQVLDGLLEDAITGDTRKEGKRWANYLARHRKNM